jgi:hypothetical protein
MRKRLQEFALSLHSEKTRLIEFGRFAAENRKRCGLRSSAFSHSLDRERTLRAKAEPV